MGDNKLLKTHLQQTVNCGNRTHIFVSAGRPPRVGLQGLSWVVNMVLLTKSPSLMFQSGSLCHHLSCLDANPSKPHLVTDVAFWRWLDLECAAGIKGCDAGTDSQCDTRIKAAPLDVSTPFLKG